MRTHHNIVVVELPAHPIPPAAAETAEDVGGKCKGKATLHGIGFSLADMCFDVSDEYLDAAISDGYATMRNVSRSFDPETSQAEACSTQ